MANDEDDNEIPVDIPDEIEQQAEDILEEMDENVDNQNPDVPFLGSGGHTIGDSFQDGFRDGVREADSNVEVDEVMEEAFGMFDGDEMFREQKIIHALQNEPQYLVKVFGAGVVLNLLVLHGGRKLGVSDFTLGTVSTALNRQLTDWMIDRYDP